MVEFYCLETNAYETIKCAAIPKVDIEEEDILVASGEININYLYQKGWDGTTCQIGFYRLFYEDLLAPLGVLASTFYPSEFISINTTVTSTCISKNYVSIDGNVWIRIKM